MQSIDASNVQVVIDGGLYTKDEICEGITCRILQLDPESRGLPIGGPRFAANRR